MNVVPPTALNRHMRLILLFLISALVCAVEHRPPNGYAPDFRSNDQDKLASGLATSLEVPPGPVALGSAWVVHYAIHNRGPAAFTWSFGGDYRGPRPLRVWLEAIGPDGSWASDPLGHTLVTCMGGIGGGIPIEPQGTSYITVNPRLYVRLDKPGRWTLRMYHDLGMGPMTGDTDPRWTTATIDLVMPDLPQARQILADHEERLRTNELGTTGQRNPPRADFPAMQFPVFLSVLEARARQGWSPAIEGIAAMPTVEATELLLELAQIEQASALPDRRGEPPQTLPQIEALQGLAVRLPPPPPDQKWQGTGDPYLMPSMTEDQKKRVIALARRLSQHTHPDVRAAVTALLARTSPDPADLLRMIGREVEKPDGEEALRALLVAFRGTGAKVPDPHSSPAAAAVWIDHLLWNRERPDGWEDVVAELLSHSAPRIRQAALQIVPWDSPRHWTPDLERLLRDDDAGVRSRALRCTERYEDVILVPAMRFAFAREQHPQSAARTIRKLGGRVAEVQAWIDHLESSPHPFAAWLAWHGLIPAMTDLRLNGQWPADKQPDMQSRQDMVKRLRAFLATRQDALLRGALTPDDSWPPDLLPPGWAIELSDRTFWPAAPR